MIQRCMPVKTVILFDLEYSDPQICRKLNKPVEIWSIGAVRVNQYSEPIDSFYSECSVSYLSPDVRYVCNNERDLTNLPKFEIIYSQFKEYCGRDNLMSWSVSDYQMFIGAAGKWEFQYPFFDALSFYAGIMAEFDCKLSYSLGAACKLMGVEKPNHNSLKDAECLSQLLRKALIYPA